MVHGVDGMVLRFIHPPPHTLCVVKLDQQLEKRFLHNLTLTNCTDCTDGTDKLHAWSKARYP